MDTAGIARPDGEVRHLRRDPVDDAERALLYDGTEKGRAAVRRGNDYGAALVQKYPKKSGQMAGVPLPDLDGSLREIAYAYDTLKVDAIGIYSNDNQGRWPGDPYFEPMWQELNRRNAIVYMHPLAPPCCSSLKYGPAASMTGASSLGFH